MRPGPSPRLLTHESTPDQLLDLVPARPPTRQRPSPGDHPERTAISKHHTPEHPPLQYWPPAQTWVMPEGTTVDRLATHWLEIAKSVNASHRLHMLAEATRGALMLGLDTARRSGQINPSRIITSRSQGRIEASENNA
jgi:hypothetical protein